MLSTLLFVGWGVIPGTDPAAASTGSTRQDPDPIHRVIAPPGVEVESGQAIPVGIYYRNEGPDAHRFVPTERVRVQIVTPRSTLDLELVRVEATPGEIELAAGATRYVAYGLMLPVELDGRVLLQFPGRESAPALIQVRRKGSPDEGAVAPDGVGAKGVGAEAVGGDGARKDGGDRDVPGKGDSTASGDATGGSTRGDAPSRAPNGGQDPLQPLAPHGADALPLPPPIPIAEHVIQSFSAHEPNYFLAGDRPTARFQLSFKYRVFNPESEFASRHPWISSTRIGFTQTSLWDIGGKSKPFTDSSYKPEVFWSRDRLDSIRIPGVRQFGLEAGLQHESNGRSGADSRSLNVLYVRPVLVLGDPEKFHWRVMPRLTTYVFDLEDNPDIADYRGHGDLRVVAGRIDALEVSALVRVGDGFDRGSLQLDATYPLHALSGGLFDSYLQLQYFNGYGESLLGYDERSESLRFGFALTR